MGLKQHDGISVPETPIIRKQDLQHEELLVRYPQEKAKPAESIIGKNKAGNVYDAKKHLQCKCFFMKVKTCFDTKCTPGQPFVIKFELLLNSAHP